MKNGTKVSWSNADGSHATRVYGTLLVPGDPAIVAQDTATKVAPAIAVAGARVVEVLDGETEQQHEARIREAFYEKQRQESQAAIAVAQAAADKAAAKSKKK